MFVWGGDGTWGQSVRGCLVCMYKHGSPAHEAHGYCYDRASGGRKWYFTGGGIRAILGAIPSNFGQMAEDLTTGLAVPRGFEP